MDNSEPKKLIFVASHRRHKKVADRLRGALAARKRVELFAFDRGTVDHPIYSDASISHTSLGRIRDGVSVSRLSALLRAAWILALSRRRILDSGAVVLVNTLELLVLCWLCGLTRLPTIYDVSDIHTLLLSNGLRGRCARWFERRALRSVGLMVVSSPWFYWEYFMRWQRASTPALLIENKVEFGGTAPLLPRAPSNAIAWNGLLRCRRSAMVLLECLTSAPTSLRLSLHGSLARLQELGPKLINCANCSYTGQYSPAALGTLLSASSFLWAVDFADGENSRWLLPNRLYEAIAAEIPLIAVDDSATGAVVRRYSIGILLPECTSVALMRALGSCTTADYELWLKNMRDLKNRAQRGKEWQQVFELDGKWSNLRMLPRKVDVGLVLRAVADDSSIDSKPPALDA